VPAMSIPFPGDGLYEGHSHHRVQGMQLGDGWDETHGCSCNLIRELGRCRVDCSSPVALESSSNRNPVVRLQLWAMELTCIAVIQGLIAWPLNVSQLKTTTSPRSTIRVPWRETAKAVSLGMRMLANPNYHLGRSRDTFALRRSGQHHQHYKGPFAQVRRNCPALILVALGQLHPCCQ
jgi:hypothetical protein